MCSLHCRSIEKRLYVVGALFGLIAVAGCGGSDKVPVYPTEALLMLDDEPFGPTQIMLIPTTEGGRTVSGVVDEKGMVTFTTYSVGDGAPAGEYRVAVGTVMAAPPRPFPVAYRDMKKSPLNVMVEAKEKNELALAMDSKIGGKMSEGNPMADKMRAAYQSEAFSAGAEPAE